MSSTDRKQHWEKIYQVKQQGEMSWYQPQPVISLQLMEEMAIPKSARIIDIGGGDSYLVDHLLEGGFSDVTILDISAHAIERAKKRLGPRADEVTWIEADVTRFEPTEQYDFWHDRATFHFLTRDEDITTYLQIARTAIAPGGSIIVGTFSEEGPDRCSGLEIQQYSKHSLSNRFEEYFEKIKCMTTDHTTPAGIIQNFVFCGFKKPG